MNIQKQRLQRAEEYIRSVAPEVEEPELSKRVIRYLCYDNLITFGIFFRQQDFLKNKSPDFHYTVSERLLDDSIRQGVQVVPRGHAKTSLTSTAVLHRFMYTHVNPATFELYDKNDSRARKEFIGWISESSDQARDNIKFVANTIYKNKELSYYFGDRYEGHYKWSTDSNLPEIVTGYGNRMIARGSGQKLRGRKEDDLRFTLLVLDDVEGESNTKTPDSRRNVKKWILGACLPALGEPPDKGRLIINGTIVHKDSFLQNIVDQYNGAKKAGRQSSWDVIFYRATHDGQLTDDSIPLWPDRFPLESLRKKRQTYIDAGVPSMFAQEYMNDPRDAADIVITDDQIQAALADYRFFLNSDGDKFIKYEGQTFPVHVFFGVDPASTRKLENDASTIVPVALDAENIAWVLPYFHQRVLPMEHAEKVFEYYDLYNPNMVNIETVAYQEMLRNYIEMEQRKRNIFMRGVGPEAGIKHGKVESKFDRLAGLLQPRFSSKSIHIQHDMDDLIQQLLDWEDSKHDDLLDGLFLALKRSYPPSQKQVELDRGEPRMPWRTKEKPKYNWMTGKRLN